MVEVLVVIWVGMTPGGWAVLIYGRTVMGQKTKDRRLKVLRLYAKGVSISDCARLAGVAYETARRYCREADFHGIEHAHKAPSFRTWSIELKTKVGSR